MKHLIEDYKFIKGGRKRVQLNLDVALINATFHIGDKVVYGVAYVNEANKGDVERIAFFVDGKVFYNNHRRILSILGVTRKDYRRKKYFLNATYDTSNYHLRTGTNGSIRISNYGRRYKTYGRHGLEKHESWSGPYNRHRAEDIKTVIKRFHLGLINFDRCTNSE